MRRVVLGRHVETRASFEQSVYICAERCPRVTDFSNMKNRVRFFEGGVVHYGIKPTINLRKMSS